RHAQVGDQDIEVFLLQVRQRLVSIVGGRHLRTLHFEKGRQGTDDLFGIVDHQNPQPLELAGRSVCATVFRMLGMSRQRQPEAECRSLPLAWGGGACTPPVRFRQLRDQRQANAQPMAILAIVLAVDLPEHGEYFREGCSLDPDAGVLYVHPGFVAFPAQGNGDRAVGGRELDGIVQQVPDDLLDPVGVAIDDDFPGGLAIQVRCQKRNLRRARLYADSIDDGADRINQPDRSAIQLQLARLYTRQVKQVANDLRLVVDGFSYLLKGTYRLGRDTDFGNAGKKFGIELDQVQRVTQFMRHD